MRSTERGRLVATRQTMRAAEAGEGDERWCQRLAKDDDNVERRPSRRTEWNRNCAGIEFPIADLNGGTHVRGNPQLRLSWRGRRQGGSHHRSPARSSSAQDGGLAKRDF